MKTQNPLIGRSRKSYGDATFYTLNGENIVRTKPMVVSNPNTPAQQAQRVRFGAFTKAANSVSEADLNMLFATKTTGRNRRSMLQAQLAPAFGSQQTTDPTAAEKYEATFNVLKLDKIGSGAIGYVGDLADAAINATTLTITSAQYSAMRNNMVGALSTDQLLIVAISEDGCIIKVIDTGKTIEDADAEVNAESPLVVTTSEFASHGTRAYCYAVGGKLQLIGLGTFSVAERAARKGNNPKHAIPV